MTRLMIYLGGMTITSFGIALIILSNVGAGPWDAVAVGLSGHTGLTVGVCSIIAQALVVLATWAIEKDRFQYGAIMAIMIRSWFLDIWLYLVLVHIDFTSSVFIQISTFAFGILSVGVGIGLYIEAKLPNTPLDGLMVAMYNAFGLSLSVSRAIIECSGVIIGFLLGGPVGLGTVIVALTLGRVVQIMNSIVKHFIKKRESTLSANR